MANDIDPITGLPPLQFERPQSEDVEKSLQERFEKGVGYTRDASKTDVLSLWNNLTRQGADRHQLADPTMGGLLPLLYPEIQNWDLQSSVRRTSPGPKGTTNITVRFPEGGSMDMGYSTFESVLNKDYLKLYGKRNNPYWQRFHDWLFENTNPSLSVEEAREKYSLTGEGKLLAGALESMEKENELLGEISNVRTGAERSMARELERRMEGIREQGGIEREFIGQQQTERGMLRSTFAGKRIAESAQREQQLVGQERVGTQQRIMSLRNAQIDLVKKIEQDRQMLLTIRDINEIEEIEKKRNMTIESNLRTQFMQALAEAQINAAEKEAFMGTVTSLATTAVMAYAVSGCWVARAIFGNKDIRWMHARAYIMEESPIWFYHWYVNNGKEFSKKVKKSRILKAILKPLFIYFAFRGKKLWSVQT